jgi:hypothetical protein
MSFYFPNVDPAYIYKRQGTTQDPFISLNETAQVVNGAVVLKEIPEFASKVVVKKADGTTLTEVTTETLQTNQYRVDYSTGVVYLPSSLESNNLTFTYKGTGYVSFPSSRVWVDSNGTASNKTLQQLVTDMDNVKTNWLVAVTTYANIATTYPTPKLGDTVQTTDDARIYRFNGSVWVNTQQYTSNAITNFQNRLDSLSKVANTYEWTAISGQLVYVLPSNVTLNDKWLEVTVGGANLPSSLVRIDSANQFTLLVNSTDIPAGIKVNARWVEPFIPATAGHKGTHEKGGYDEIDVTKLKNYQESIATPLADIAINVKSKGAKGDGTTNDTVAVQSAISSLPNGGVLFFPKGDYIVNNVELPSNILVRGAGRDATKIKRNADNPVFKVTGTALPNGGSPSHWNISFEDLTISSIGTFNTDLTQFQGVTAMSFNRMKFYAQECRLVFANQMWDSRFQFVEFFEGGRDDGTPALELAGGLNGYRMTKETVIDNCHFESYKGSAIRTLRDTNTSNKTGMMTFSNLKFESKLCTGNHLNLELNNTLFSNVYITTEFTTTDVVKMVNCRGIQGNLAFFYVTGTVGAQVPQSLVNIDSGGYLIDLRILVEEPQPNNANVVTLANISEVTINLNIVAAQTLINGVSTSMGRMGKGAIWIDSAGKPRISSAKPSNLDTSGYGVMRQVFGNTSQRPTGLTVNDIGYFYFDTTLLKPIWWYHNGISGAWKDATGTSV